MTTMETAALLITLQEMMEASRLLTPYLKETLEKNLKEIGRILPRKSLKLICGTVIKALTFIN